jgi:hypothetical protein
MTTERDLIQRMADELDHYRQLLMDDLRETHALANEARALLSQSEPKGPTVMEIIALADEIEAKELGQVDLVRRALARWGRPELIRALELAEAALADIGDAEREPGDDLAWAEARAAQDLPRIRAALARWGSALPTPQP